MVQVRDHLALVFHRFIEAQGNAVHVSITLNSRPVPSLDPFLTGHRATQVSEAETVEIDGESVRLQAFTLPYINRMTSADKHKAQVSGTLRDTQGFYVYRAGRLVIWGTWFRIVPKDDLGKLARVRVDIPNSLDHLWALDIKKSTAAPPPAVRNVLKRLATRFVHPSRTTHTYRGRPTAADPTVRVWQVVDERGEFRYEVNRSHPAIETLADGLDDGQLRDFQRVLQTIEASFPVEDAYNRMGRDSTHRPATIADDEIKALAQHMWARRREAGDQLDDFIKKLAGTEPFSSMRSPETELRRVLS